MKYVLVITVFPRLALCKKSSDGIKCWSLIFVSLFRLFLIDNVTISSRITSKMLKNITFRDYTNGKFTSDLRTSNRMFVHATGYRINEIKYKFVLVCC